MKLGKRAPLHAWRMCISKKTFRSADEAEVELASFKKQLETQERGFEVDRLHTYLCDYCQQWHIGHMPRPLRYVEVPS